MMVELAKREETMGDTDEQITENRIKISILDILHCLVC
jgi:hypothetical protein